MQQQQLALKEGVNSISEIATWENRAGVRDETKNATEVEKWTVGTHLSEQEVITEAFSNNAANAQEIERVKIGSN